MVGCGHLVFVLGFVCISNILSVVPANINICLAAINVCAGLYSLSKICIYLFLAERLHVITTKGPRHKNKLYMTSAFLLILFIVVALLFFVFPVAVMRGSNCHIGVRKHTGILMVAYDTFFGLFQVGTFAFTLNRLTTTGPNNDPHANAVIREALKVAVFGSAVAFMLSFLNILSLPAR